MLVSTVHTAHDADTIPFLEDDSLRGRRSVCISLGRGRYQLRYSSGLAALLTAFLGPCQPALQLRRCGTCAARRKRWRGCGRSTRRQSRGCGDRLAHDVESRHWYPEGIVIRMYQDRLITIVNVTVLFQQVDLTVDIVEVLRRPETALNPSTYLYAVASLKYSSIHLCS